LNSRKFCSRQITFYADVAERRNCTEINTYCQSVVECNRTAKKRNITFFQLISRSGCDLFPDCVGPISRSFSCTLFFPSFHDRGATNKTVFLFTRFEQRPRSSSEI